jgi:hypothetical protein
MIDWGIGAIGTKRMGEMLEKNASLKTFSLFGENLLNNHSSPVGSTLRYSGTYVYIWRVVVSLTEGWTFLSSLYVCWTAGNDGIGDEGAIGIAKGLEMNISLKEMDLGGVFPAHIFFIYCCISYHSVLF